MYQKTLDTDIEKGHVKPVIFSSIAPSRVWYLPHHPVTNPNKPGKVRRVSNAASLFKGNSLNSNILTGPDLNNNLVGLLLRFRENPVAISADIEATFMQVGIIEKNQPSMRFLWPTNQSVEQFQYTRLIFGARCSPSTAIFVLQKTAADLAPNQMIQNLVKNSFYMDVFVHSFQTVEIAQEAAGSLKTTLMTAGFKLTKFVSNEQTAIDNVNDGDENSKDCHRVLGVQWNKSTDKFFHQKPSKFDTNADNYTVRKLLSLIACLFDPLGIIATVISTLKIILQEIWKEGLAWDDHLPRKKRKSIQTWIDNYMCSSPIEVPHCLTLDVATSKTFELHVFTDASQLAYGAVAYARIIS